MFVIDLTNGPLNGGGAGPGTIVLGRSATSPNLEINTTLSTINGTGPYHQNLSGSPSPILSQSDDILSTDGTMAPGHLIPSSGNGTGAANSSGGASSGGSGGGTGSASGTGNGSLFHHTRSASGKLTPMQIRCKYGQLGPSKGQFNSPHGFCLGSDEDIIVADTNNHRIQVNYLNTYF